MAEWSDCVAATSALPGVVETTTYGAAPALKVRGKIVCWYRDRPEALAVPVADLAEKEALLGGSPDVYFTTDHYDGHAYVLVHLERIGVEELGELLEDAWRLRAGVRAVQAFDAVREAGDAGDDDGGEPATGRA